jgi:hypothetical protein
MCIDLKKKKKKKSAITSYVRQIPSKFVEYSPPRNIYSNWMTNPFTGTLQIEELAIDEYKICKILWMMRFQNQNFPPFQAIGPA